MYERDNKRRVEHVMATALIIYLVTHCQTEALP